MTHIQRRKPRRSTSTRLRKLLNQMANTTPPRTLKKLFEKKPKRTARYFRVKSKPPNYSRRNHALLRRLKSSRFLTPTGHVKSSLRQILASQGIHQKSRLESTWDDILDRMNQISLPKLEQLQFNRDFNQWYKQGCPETRENYFWRIKYCGLIELGLDYKHWKAIKQLHEQRHNRGLKSSIDYE
jgi:hypothetical protein